MTATERRDLILLTLTLAREYQRLWGREPTVKEIEEHCTGKRSL